MAQNADGRRQQWLQKVQSEDNFQKQKWLRDRAKSSENSITMVYNTKNQQDRVKIEMGCQNKKSFEPLNTETLYDSKFKKLALSNDSNKRPFVTMSSSKDKAWNIVPLKDGITDYDPYNEKFKADEDCFRKRNSLKEVGNVEFDSNARPDLIWSNRLQTSNSLRTYHQIKGQIITIEGNYESEIQTPRNNFETVKSLKSSKTTQNTRFLKRIQLQQGSENSSNANRSRIEYSDQSQSLNIIGPVPTKFKISSGDVSKVEEIMNLKKEFTQKASLFYVPDQQIQSTQNIKYKGSAEISDSYIMSKLQHPQQKSYYKSAETNLKKSQIKILNQTQDRNQGEQQLVYKELSVRQGQNTNSGFQRNNSQMSEIITTIDIGQLLLNEKLRDGSKDNSPLISSKRQLSINSGEDQDISQQMQLLSPNSGITLPTSLDFYTSETSPSVQGFMSQQGKIKNGTISIQEESEETEEDSPKRKKLEQTQLIKIQNQARKRKDSISSSVSLLAQKTNYYNQMKAKAEIEKKKREFYALNPIIHKDLRSQHLNDMMSDFFSSDSQQQHEAAEQKDSQRRRSLSKRKL
ncbi:UNKNOWN [Stylonychia lemnae]|uniref:Uncharacterized protein n=1 Tax=Stylonychia lemnae TaxID=5949 RepID=A0A078B0F9_STYLE|nr:UNKNOWN [Stylonychia lemnae]|eukprot:CDW88140.1 UNKNOWN [Stylonychia lemnae]